MDFYEEWEPIESPPLEFYLYELNDGFEGLKIVLKEFGSNRGLEIFYSNFLGFRVVEESGRLKTLYENDTIGSFNKTKHSEFLNWFREESRGMFDDHLIHYNIVSSNKIVDIISTQQPNTKWLT